MKILHIYKDYFPVLGGMENHIRWLAEAQVAAGHDVTVLVTHPQRRTTDDIEQGVRVIRAARLATVASTPLSLAMPRLLRAHQPDVAHLHFPYPPGEVSQWLLGRARHTVMTYHSDVVRQKGMLRIYEPLMRRILQRVDRIIATSPQYVASSPYLHPLRDKVTVIPLGIDVQRFQEPDRAQVAAIQQRYGAPLLLFVGRLRYYKGVQYLLDALPQVADARLLIAGTGPMAQPWQAQARALGLAERVFFLGDVADADLPAYYAAADLFVLPACERSEAFGVVQVEALASGTPIVSTELGTGTSYVNQDGVTGRVVPAGEAAALAGALRTLLADRALRHVMGMAARQRAASEFSLPVMVGRIENLYRSLGAGQSAFSA